jgi:hypothetical protein
MKYRLFIIILLLPLFISAQKVPNIIQLKNGALFVRLKTSENTIDALKSAGEYERAQRVFEHQQKENLEIIDAFMQEYNFSPLYFFSSSDSRKVLDRDFEGVLLDQDLTVVKEVPPDNISFFIAEFWHIERSDEGTFQANILKDDTTGYRSKQAVYTGDTELGPDALIIRGPDFVQLDHPFPFFVRTYEGFPVIRRAKKKVVAKLNKKLNDYHMKVKR